MNVNELKKKYVFNLYIYIYTDTDIYKKDV